ncbi:MAG: SEC-C domain-containing protein [Candidatus Omnitrophota bacterium]
MITIFDVIDNFFYKEADKNILTMPGRALYSFGEEVRKYAQSFCFPQVDRSQYPIYIGGWPSANFWDSQNGSLVMSSLLYSGQILAKDPISDWFSYEQYQIPKLMASRRGFYFMDKHEVDIAGTRQFLAIVIPALQKLRPLIENNTLILVPSNALILEGQATIGNISQDIIQRISKSVNDFTNTFRPSELAVADNVRGVFPFAGGNREEQIIRAIDRSVNYFVSEYYLATKNGFNYVAPFRYESYLCEEGLGNILNEFPNERILQAIFNSNLSIYSGLTPKLISEIRDDDNFASFRSELFKIYNNIPAKTGQEKLNQYISEAEDAVLKPILFEIEKDAKSGILAKLGINPLGSVFRISGGVSLGLLTKTPNTVIKVAATELINLVSKLIEKKDNQKFNVIWKKLYMHNRNHLQELPRAKDSPKTNAGEDNELWGIPEKPSMSILVTEGTMLWEMIPDFITEDLPKEYPIEDVYTLCPCGSRRKFKFCCQGLEKIKLQQKS